MRIDLRLKRLNLCILARKLFTVHGIKQILHLRGHAVEALLHLHKFLIGHVSLDRDSHLSRFHPSGSAEHPVDRVLDIPADKIHHIAKQRNQQQKHQRNNRIELVQPGIEFALSGKKYNADVKIIPPLLIQIRAVGSVLRLGKGAVAHPVILLQKLL